MSEHQPNAIHEVAGSEALIQWFGKWPSFHDAEVLSIALSRIGKSSVRIHTWEMTEEVDAKGFYVLQKHVQVTFFLEGLKDIDLVGFNHQNVISSLAVTRAKDGLQLHLAPCYGVAGAITAEAIRVEIEPGKPADRSD